MVLYNLFSYNVKVQYVSCFFSLATFFTLTTTILNLILPFIIAYVGRGLWLRSHSFYEQPVVNFSYEYLLVAESNDLSRSIACGETNGNYANVMKNEDNCAEFEVCAIQYTFYDNLPTVVHYYFLVPLYQSCVLQYDLSGNGKIDLIDFKINLQLPQEITVTSIWLILSLDFQLKSVCPMHMQSLAVVNKEFTTPPSGFKYFGDLQFYQTSHLPCKQNLIHTKYNYSLFNSDKNTQKNAIDHTLENYFMRDVTTHTKTLYSRSQNGHTGSMQMHISLRVPEMEIKYTPSLIQELKWAWPQYLSLIVVFYWLFNKIKMFIFKNRLVMAWEIQPWKKEKRIESSFSNCSTKLQKN